MISKQLKLIAFIAVLLSLSACVPTDESKNFAESNTTANETSSDSNSTNADASEPDSSGADASSTNNDSSTSVTKNTIFSDSALPTNNSVTRQQAAAVTPPKNIHIKRGNGIVRIVWKAVKEADYYNIYMQTANNDASLVKQTQNAQETEFFVEESNETLSIYIRSVLNDIESSPSTLIFVSKLLTSEEDTATGSTTIKNNNGK